MSSDSLYEPDGNGGYWATQASIMGHNADGTVAAQTRWRLAAGQWYVISTTLMDYTDQGLVSATTYEGDGTSGRLMDSLAYAVDTYGNRTLEQHFDNERTKRYEIVYTWLDMQPKAVVSGMHRGSRHTVAWRNGRVEFGTAVCGHLTLCRLDGRRVHTHALRNDSSVRLPDGLCAGRYVAILTGEMQRSFSLTIYN